MTICTIMATDHARACVARQRARSTRQYRAGCGPCIDRAAGCQQVTADAYSCRVICWADAPGDPPTVSDFRACLRHKQQLMRRRTATMLPVMHFRLRNQACNAALLPAGDAPACVNTSQARLSCLINIGRALQVRRRGIPTARVTWWRLHRHYSWHYQASKHQQNTAI